MKTKQEYASHLKHLIHLDKFPQFKAERWPYNEIPFNAWSYFVGTSSIFWKQKAEGVTWVIMIEADKNGIIQSLKFTKGEWLDYFVIPDQVANDSINALQPYIKEKTPLWKFGIGIVGLVFILNLFGVFRFKKK